jgi:hypothetical protein
VVEEQKSRLVLWYVLVLLAVLVLMWVIGALVL